MQVKTWLINCQFTQHLTSETKPTKRLIHIGQKCVIQTCTQVYLQCNMAEGYALYDTNLPSKYCMSLGMTASHMSAMDSFRFGAIPCISLRTWIPLLRPLSGLPAITC